MRAVTRFGCAGETLAGVLDHGTGATGLLIVSGGNEIAIGPQRAMARLATLIASAGWPVFRFDRRGIGDSGGTNGGFASSAPDISAAIDCFGGHGARRIVAFGNCDAATALAIHALDARDQGATIVARVLANPWLDLAQGDLPAPAAIKSHYRRRLADPAAWRALVSGRIDVRKAVRGLARIAAPAPPPLGLADAFATGLRDRALPTRIVLSERDGTGIAFADAWERAPLAGLRGTVRLDRIPTAAHGFTGDEDLRALAAILSETLRSVAAPAAAG